MNWLTANVEWIFSGIGVAVVGWLFFRSSPKNSVKQKVLKSNNVTQIGGNISIRESNDKPEGK